MYNTLFIHVCYPKTASTTLQMHFFPQINNSIYLGKHYKGLKIFDFDEQIFNKVLFFPNKQTIDSNIKLLRNKIDKTLKRSNIIISNEKITYSSLRFSNIENSISQFYIIDNLNKLFPPHLYDIRIIINIRKQIEIISSIFAQSYTHYFSKNSVSNSFNKFLNNLIDIQHGGKYSNNLLNFHHALEYDKILDYYINKFGKNNIHLLIYEELLYSPEDYYRRLLGYLNQKDYDYKNLKMNEIENKRLIEDGGKLTRKYSLYDQMSYLKKKYFKGYEIAPGCRLLFKPLKKINLPRKKENKIIQYEGKQEKNTKLLYHNNNQRLKKSFNIDLDTYLY